MSKNIKAGTWWLDSEGDIVYVAFTNSNLPFDIKKEDYRIVAWWYSSSMSGPLPAIVTESSLVRELPDCTGFDYKVPPEEPKCLKVEGSPTWVPFTGHDGQQYMFLGYVCQPVDATAG